MGILGRGRSLTLPLLVGCVLAAVIALALTVYLLAQPPTTETETVSGEEETASQASGEEEAEGGAETASPPDVSQTVQAVNNYYATVGRGDYVATYRMLANADKRHYTQAEWIRANRNVDSAAARYVVHSAETAGRNRVQVDVTVYLPDGSSFERQTNFIWQGDEWRHNLSGEERAMFDNAL